MPPGCRCCRGRTGGALMWPTICDSAPQTGHFTATKAALFQGFSHQNWNGPIRMEPRSDPHCQRPCNRHHHDHAVMQRCNTDHRTRWWAIVVGAAARCTCRCYRRPQFHDCKLAPCSPADSVSGGRCARDASQCRHQQDAEPCTIDGHDSWDGRPPASLSTAWGHVCLA